MGKRRAKAEALFDESYYKTSCFKNLAPCSAQLFLILIWKFSLIKNMNPYIVGIFDFK